MTCSLARAVRSPIIAIGLFGGLSSHAQEFIPNNGFEDGSIQCGLYGQPTFNSNVSLWQSPTIGSPDIFHVSLPGYCANAATGSMDEQSWGSEEPYDGEAMLALISYCPACATETREYAQAQLLQPLTPGTSYHARMFVSRADRCRYATNDLGLFFSVSPPAAGGWESLPFTPQVKVSNVVTSATGWELVAGEFVADDAYNYITIGNFSDDASVVSEDLGTAPLDFAVYFIDGVSLTPSGLGPYITGDALLCEGDQTVLTAQNSSSVSWSTEAEPGTILSTEMTLDVSPSITTTYLLVQGTDTARFTVQVLPAPNVFLGNDTTLCVGETLLLDAGTSGPRYRWQDGSGLNTFLVEGPGAYSVTVSLGSCTASDTILVEYAEVPSIDLGNDTTLCPGASLLLDATTSGATYSWSDGSTAASIWVNEAGIYSVAVTRTACTTVDSILVFVESIPIAGALMDTVLCREDALRYQLYPPGASWIWQDGNGASPYYITEGGSYVVTVETALCTHTSLFDVTLIECEPLLVMPTVISPNGDGVNDVFLPITLRGMARAELAVHNRWGQELFISTDLHRGWTARDAPEGTYFWVVRYTDVLGRAGSKSGHVTVLR